MSSIKGKDCMVQAVTSVTGNTDVSPALDHIRTRQLEETFGSDFNIELEMTSLGELLTLAGYTGSINHLILKSFTEIKDTVASCKYDGVLLGFRAGPDNPRPHIQHVNKFSSDNLGLSGQGMLDSERIIM